MAIRELRWSFRETQKQFAVRLKVSENSVLKYETGVHSPKASVLRELIALSEQQQLKNSTALFREALNEKLDDLRRGRSQTIFDAVNADPNRPAGQIAVNLVSDNLVEFGQRVSAHRVLWAVAERQLATAMYTRNAKSDVFLAAALLGYMTLEAYLDYVAVVTRLRKPGNRSTSELFVAIVGKLGTEIDIRQRPFASLMRLIELRNRLVHGFPHSELLSAQERLSRSLRDFEVELLLADLKEFAELLETKLKLEGLISR